MHILLTLTVNLIVDTSRPRSMWGPVKSDGRWSTEWWPQKAPACGWSWSLEVSSNHMIWLCLKVRQFLAGLKGILSFFWPACPYYTAWLKKNGPNFISLYFKIRTSDKHDVNYIWLYSQWSLKVGDWMLKRRWNTRCTAVAVSVLMNSRTQKKILVLHCSRFALNWHSCTAVH